MYMHVYCIQYSVHRLLSCIFATYSALCNVHTETASDSHVGPKVLPEFIVDLKHDGCILSILL